MDLAAVMRLVIEDMRQRRRKPLRDSAVVGNGYVGKTAGQRAFVQIVNKTLDASVFYDACGPQIRESRIEQLIKVRWRLTAPGKAFQPDTVGNQNMVQRSHGRPEKCASVARPLLAIQVRGGGIELFVGPKIVSGEHGEVLFH